jgi:hypothetical protein
MSNNNILPRALLCKVKKETNTQTHGVTLKLVGHAFTMPASSTRVSLTSSLLLPPTAPRRRIGLGIQEDLFRADQKIELAN